MPEKPELRIGYSPGHQQRLAKLMALFDISSKSQFVEFMIDRLWMETDLNSSARGIKSRAAKILTSKYNWVTPLTPQQIDKAIVGDLVTVYLRGVGEPYRITLKEWDEAQ